MIFLLFLFLRTLADLYEHADWSQRSLEGPLKAVKEQVTKCKLNLMSIEHLKYYHKEIAERAKAGHVSSFTTLWSLVQEMFLHEKVWLWSCHTFKKHPLIFLTLWRHGIMCGINPKWSRHLSVISKQWQRIMWPGLSRVANGLRVPQY